MKFEPTYERPGEIVAYNVRAADGSDLGRVARRKTSVDDVRRGKIFGQKSALRWFPTLPGETFRHGDARKFHTRAEAAAELERNHKAPTGGNNE